MNKLPQKLFHATVLNVETVAKEVRKIRFLLSEPFSFSVGQYVWVEIPHMAIPDTKGSRQAFSIINVPDEKNEIEIVVKINQSGYRQNLCGVQPGEEILIHGPFGYSFAIDNTSQNSIAMIAGGIGIAAHIPILKTLQSQKNPPHCFLAYYNKNKDEAPFLSELAEYKKSGNWFTYAVHYRQFEWQDVANALPHTMPPNRWLINGSQVFVDHIYGALKEGNIPEQEMEFRDFYPTTKNNLTIEQVKKDLQSDNLFVRAIQNSTNYTIITDAAGIVLFANTAAQKITGYSENEMLGNTPRLWGGMMSRDFYQDFWSKKLSGQPFVGGVISRNKRGRIYYSIAHIVPIVDEHAQTVGFISTEEDITESYLQQEEIKQKSYSLEKSATEREAILKSIGDCLITTDNGGRITFVNKAFEDTMGWKADEMSGKLLTDTIVMTDKDRAPVPPEERPIVEAVQNKSPVTAAMHYQKKDGTSFPAYSTVSPIFIRGELLGAVEVFRDMTKEAEVDQAKSEFVSLASHQLRTPLSAINWYTEMLLAGDAGKVNDEQKKYLEEVYAGSQRMVDLVNSLLNVSRLDLGTFIIEPKPTNVIVMAKSVVAELRFEIEEKNLALQESYDERVPLFQADEKLLRMVFQNLLSNAVKYTNTAGRVSVHVTITDKQAPFGGKTLEQESLCITVQDSGMGIPIKQQEKIFSKLFRANNAKESEAEGTGLGLYIIKSIVDNSGGSIWFESEENVGTAFYVAFAMAGMKTRKGSKALS